jgi:hypothetical protein
VSDCHACYAGQPYCISLGPTGPLSDAIVLCPWCTCFECLVAYMVKLVFLLYVVNLSGW